SGEAEWTLNEAREALTEAGVRAEDVTEPVLQLIARLKKESPFHWKNKAAAIRRELLEKVRATATAEAARLTRPQLLDRVNQAVARLPGSASAQYSVAFRKFEDATEDDLRSMLEELAILENLEKDQH